MSNEPTQPTPTPTTHDRARDAIARHFRQREPEPILRGWEARIADAVLAALEAAGLAVVDAMLAPPDVGREELAIELCREIGAEVYQLVNGDIDQMCGIVGIHEPEGWLSVADALLATWRVVRRD